MRRIFTQYRDGKAPGQIARDLKAERVPAPLDDSARKKPIKGWPMSTVRALLRNAKYAGHWTWNVRKYTSISGQRTRKAKKRDDADLVVIEQPALAIIDHQTWTATLQRHHKQKGEAACSNGMSISEQSLLTAIQEALSRLQSSSTFERAYLAAFTSGFPAL